MGNFNTSDSNFADLNGSMTTTGNNINTYHSNNLGDATNINNRPAPPPVSCVLTFSNGTQYTICGHPSGTGFSGKAQQGSQSCPASGVRADPNDDWTATAVNPKPNSKPGKKLTVKSLIAPKAAVKSSGKTKPTKKSSSKAKPAKKSASKPKPVKKSSAKAKPAKKTASKKR
jgi:hypothetical protein